MHSYIISEIATACIVVAKVNIIAFIAVAKVNVIVVIFLLR